MNPYRGKQFFNALTGKPSKLGLIKVKQILSCEQLALFLQMQPSEQCHSLAVMQHIVDQSEEVSDEFKQDLLVAALLHDIGKSKHPLRIWERVMVVLVNALSPTLMRRLGEGDPDSWQRAFVVSQMHAEWGANMAENAGASALTVELIRNHQNYLHGEGVSISSKLLKILRTADGKS